MSRTSKVTLAGLLIVLAAEGWVVYKRSLPTYVTGWGVPNIAKMDHGEAAMEHSRQLLAMMKASNWNADNISLEMMQSPDRRFAELEYL